MLLYCEQTHGCTSIHSHTHLHIHAACACNVCTHTPITRTSAPERHETAPRAASAAAVAAADCMLACCNSCCCCMLLREIGLPLIITLASTPSRATQRNTSRGDSSFLFLPPFLFLPGPPLQHHRNFLAARNVTYILLRASRSQGSPTNDISPGSPESTY